MRNKKIKSLAIVLSLLFNSNIATSQDKSFLGTVATGIVSAGILCAATTAVLVASCPTVSMMLLISVVNRRYYNEEDDVVLDYSHSKTNKRCVERIHDGQNRGVVREKAREKAMQRLSRYPNACHSVEEFSSYIQNIQKTIIIIRHKLPAFMSKKVEYAPYYMKEDQREYFDSKKYRELFLMEHKSANNRLAWYNIWVWHKYALDIFQDYFQMSFDDYVSTYGGMDALIKDIPPQEQRKGFDLSNRIMDAIYRLGTV